ncbi:MAG: hypothetical protein NC184_03635 [Roseburia sp.]|nr:hypothetical protein [Roseburia sp.]
MNEKPKNTAQSGAYYYIQTDDDELAKRAFACPMLIVISFLLQLVTLIMPQGCLEYVTNNISSYAYVYVWAVFIMIITAITVIILGFTRYKIAKRIPVERAPKNGFKRRTFLGVEIYTAFTALMLVFELSFVCIHYDGWGLAAMFVCALSLAAAIVARQVYWLTLRNAELISPDTDEKESEEENDKDNNDNNNIAEA